jgi:hypothetical protein
VTDYTEFPPHEQGAAEAILEYLKPAEELGWEGVSWFSLENAKELVGHLWAEGYKFVRVSE